MCHRGAIVAFNNIDAIIAVALVTCTGEHKLTHCFTSGDAKSSRAGSTDGHAALLCLTYSSSGYLDKLNDEVVEYTMLIQHVRHAQAQYLLTHYTASPSLHDYPPTCCTTHCPGLC